MKLSTGITLFNKQANKVHKINKNDILDKNCNFSVPIIDDTNNKLPKKKYLERKEKVTLIKSFCNNEKNNRSKSNSNSKEYKQRYKSNNINNVNQNIYGNNNNSFNQNQIYIDKNKYIFSSYILNPLFGLKVYENVVNKIFEFIKSILSKKIYLDIKKAFIKFIFEELHVKTDLFLKKTDSDLMNSNLKLFYNKTLLANENNNKNKNQTDFSFTRNHNNNKAMNNRNYNTGKNNISKQYIFNGLLKNHNSMYSLNKGCAKIQGGPFGFNLSRSPPKSKSKSGSKDKKLVNKNVNKNYLSNNNIFDPDLHVFKILNQRKKNSRSNKNFSNNNKYSKIQKQLNNNLIFDKKNKTNNFINNKISNIIIYSDKKSKNKMSNKSINPGENITKKGERIIEENKNNKNESYYNENSKNAEQLKQIKSGLDENLKFLFNFSYENFLNKESESESKKSVSDINIIETSNHKKNQNNNNINNSKFQDISYQPKYK